MPKDRRIQHNEMQIEYFDQRVNLFQQPIPIEVQARTTYIVQKAGVGADSQVLDVGTGAGVLLEHFLSAGARQENLVGCDLCDQMMKVARHHYPEVYFWLGDVMDFSFLDLPHDFPKHLSGFDFVFFNACFANMLDRQSVLKHCRELLKMNGKIVISHPAHKFVSWLHENDPQIVPHVLPTFEEATIWSQTIGFVVEHFESSDDLYLAVLKRSE